MAFSLVATLIFGAGPALALTRRAAAADLKRQTGDEGRRPGGVRIGNALVIGQIALSLLLLASGGLFMMSVIRAATADPGFRLDGGVIVEVDPALAGYDEARGRQAHLALLDRLRTVPGVEAVTIGSRLPFTSGGDSREVAPFGVAQSDPERVEGSRSVDAAFSVVGRDYARVLGLPMLGGRDFSDAELSPGSRERVAIIDDALAEKLWPGEDALGRLIQFLDAKGPEAKQPILVVGIIPAVKHSLGNPQPYPHVYVPLGQHYESAMTLQLRVAGGERTGHAGHDRRASCAMSTSGCRSSVSRPGGIISTRVWTCRSVEPAPACSRRSAASRCCWRSSASTASSRTSSRGGRASSASGSPSAHSHAPCCGRCCERAAASRPSASGSACCWPSAPGSSSRASCTA